MTRLKPLPRLSGFGERAGNEPKAFRHSHHWKSAEVMLGCASAIRSMTDSLI